MSQQKSRPAVGIGVILFNRQGQLLLGKRKSENGQGTWSVPGGYLEKLESLEEAATREVAEETGLKIENPRVMRFCNYVIEEEDYHFLDVYMTADIVGDDQKEIQLMEPDKCEGWRWFDLGDLPRPLFREYGEEWSKYLMKKGQEKLLDGQSCQPGIDYIGITTAMFCHDGEGNFLLNKRTDKCRDEHGKWDAWGGRVEFGEELEEAALRELEEECGARVVQIKQAGVSNALRKNEKGEKTHWLVIVFLVEIEKGTEENREPEKFAEIGWFHEGAWPKGLHSMLLADFEIAKSAMSEEG